MSKQEESPISIDDFRNRVLSVEPDPEFLSKLANCTDAVFKAMLCESGHQRWRTALRKIFLDPITDDIRKKFQGEIGIRLAIISNDGERFTPVLNSNGVMSSEHLLDIEGLLQEGIDRPHKWYIEVDPIDRPEMHDFRVISFTEILISYYFGAARVKKYAEALKNVLPVVCVYDLSLLQKARGKRDYSMPKDLEICSRLIKAVYPFDVTPLLPQEL